MTMDMSEKMAREIAQQLGLGSSKNVSRQTVQSLEGKSDEELGRLQAQLAANNIGPEQQKALVKQLMPMMNGKQRARLEKIIRILG